MHSQKNNYLPWVMWLFPLLFFAYQFVLRLWPGLMMQHIMTQFSIDASGFGLVAAFYYYGYSGMQIPVALLLDKFGARMILFIFAVLCGLALLLFSYTNNFYLALLSRFLIGAGSAVGFLGVSKVVSEWFESSQYSKMIGLSFSFGLLGAIYGGKPISMLLLSYHWQSIALVLAMMSILIGCCSYFVLRSSKKQLATNTQAINIKDLSILLSSRIIWTLAFANLLMVGSLEGFADVWGIPYLVKAYGINQSDAALLVSFIYVGMLFGGPLLAFLSKQFSNYAILTACGIGLASAFTFLLSNWTSNWWVLTTLFFVIGLMCCYQVIVFSAGAALVSTRYLGVTVAFLNSINMLGGSFFHTIIGKMIDLFWSGAIDPNGIKQYDLVSFQYALGLIPICAAIGALLTYLIHVKIRGNQVSHVMHHDVNS